MNYPLREEEEVGEDVIREEADLILLEAVAVDETTCTVVLEAVTVVLGEEVEDGPAFEEVE